MARQSSTNTSGGSFDEKTIEAVWQKGKPEPPYASFRKDACGASMMRDKYGKTERWGWEIDHIKPVGKGGDDDVGNLQPLQWENNRHKADDYPSYNCKIKS
ncbi:MAG: HNH endonuclease signature motif containing protein [Candidatus Acidiferrales bacterium]